MAVRQIYTDNITLTPNDRQSQLVTDVGPELYVRGQGGRLDLSLAYRLEALLFPSGDFDNEVNNQLEARGTAELLKQFLFLDADSTIQQTNANDTGPLASSNVSRTGNIINTYTYRVSPYARNHLGSFADSEARYAFDDVINQGSTLDSTSNLARVQVDSGSRFVVMPWQFSAQGQRVDFSDGTNTKFAEGALRLRYVIGRGFSVLGNGGYQFINFASNRPNEKNPIWDAGLMWTPSRRTSVTATYGHRFFGDTVNFALEHQRRRTIWRATFSEGAGLNRNVVLQRQLVALTDPFGNPIADPLAGARIRVPTTETTPTSEVLIIRHFDGSFAFRGLRTELDVGAFHDKQTFEETGGHQTVYGMTASSKRRLTRRTTLEIGGRWQKTDFRDSSRKDARWEANAVLRRRIRDSVDGSIEYDYTNVNSNESENDFIENRVTAAITVRF